jgi:hypothetical protein
MMALLTDGNPNTSEALRAYETAVLDVAHVEMIDLDAKLSLATDEISQDVLDVLVDHTWLHDLQAKVRRMMGVSDVVVTPQLRRWHALRTLDLLYRDAYNNQLNDRYRQKWDEYVKLSRDARERALRFGIGLVAEPVPRAVMPVFSVAPGLIPATTYYTRVSWVSTVGQEGSPSEVTTYQTVDGSLLVVQPVNPPAAATAWNVYLGQTDSTVTLQNSAPIAVGQTFTLPPTGLVTGKQPGDGQTPDMYVSGGRLLRRG